MQIFHVSLLGRRVSEDDPIFLWTSSTCTMDAPLLAQRSAKTMRKKDAHASLTSTTLLGIVCLMWKWIEEVFDVSSGIDLLLGSIIIIINVNYIDIFVHPIFISNGTGI
jgi:hypothetical protein